MWRPLPFPQPERLVAIWAHNLEQTWRHTVVSAPDFADWRQRAHAFDRLAAREGSNQRNLSVNGFTDRPRVTAVSAGFFETLGVSPAAGHTFNRANEHAGRLNEAILSDALSRRAFGSPQAALGKTVRLDGAAYTVIGILPAHFRLEVLRTPDVFVPLDLASKQRRDDRELAVIGRLRDGVNLKSAQVDMEAVTRQLAAEHPDTNASWSATVENLRTSFTVYARNSLLLYFAFSVFVLIVACANVATLQLIRSVVRQREFAIREALGAGRPALIRQALAESGWIALVGGASGILLAVWGMHALQLLPLEEMLPRQTAMSLDKWSVTFAVVVSMISTFLFGLAPGFSASSASLESAVRDSGKSMLGSLGMRRRIGLLAGAQVMLAFLSLFGAGLFVATDRALHGVPLGFHARNIFAMLIPLSGVKYSRTAGVRAFYRAVIEQAGATGGVRECALASDLPLRGALEVNFVRADRPRPLPGQEPNSLDRIVTPGYFHLLGIPVLQGRAFTEHDSESARRVAMVNQNLAHHFFPGEKAVGKQLLILTGGDAAVPAGNVEIVGVASNTKEVGLNEVDFDDIYFPFAQNPSRVMFAIIKSNAPAPVAPVLRKKFQDLDGNEFVSEARSMDSYVREALQGDRFRLTLIGTFAAIALLLTAIALYGAVSFTVAQRTREFGLRIALGSPSTGVLRLTLRHVLRLAITGSACGVMVALVTGEIFGRAFYLVPHEHVGMLYGVGIRDPVSLACAAALVLVCAILAGLLPAIRATRTDPCEALRYQ